MTTLQKIVTAAKKLKKQHPNKYSKWTDYVKAAAKTIKPAAKKVGAVKKKKAPASRHTDKGSHNVKIKVVSGFGKTDIERLNYAIKAKNELENTLATAKKTLPKYRDEQVKLLLKTLPQLIRLEKTIITTLKKKIK